MQNSCVVDLVTLHYASNQFFGQNGLRGNIKIFLPIREQEKLQMMITTLKTSFAREKKCVIYIRRWVRYIFGET